MTLPLSWHDDVPADLRAVRQHYGEVAYEEVRALIASLPGDPLLGDWLENHPDTGDLSACRKVKAGPDDADEQGNELGPALRIVYQLLPSNTDVQRVRIHAVARRKDLEAYALAAARLAEEDDDARPAVRGPRASRPRDRG